MDKIVLAMALGLAAIVSLIVASLVPVRVPHSESAAAWERISAEANCTDAGCAEDMVRKCDSSSQIAILKDGGKSALAIEMAQEGADCRVIVVDIELERLVGSVYRCDLPLVELAGMQAESFDGFVSKIIGSHCAVA